MTARLLTLDPSEFKKEQGYSYSLAMSPETQGDTSAHPSASKTRLFEDGIELGPAHSEHRYIAERGCGRYSHWHDRLVFSSSDNSSPLDTGRSYTLLYEHRPPEAGKQVLPNSALPLEALCDLQKGLLAYTYRGIECLKCPFDLALYQLLMWKRKPRTIVELGTWKGGSALWFADQMTAFGIDGHVHSVDIAAAPALVDQRITFHTGNVMKLEQVLPVSWLCQQPRPLLVIEDSGHFFELSMAVLSHFAPLMRPGEYIIIEDAIISEMNAADNYRGGPRRAIEHFLRANRDFTIDRDLCDFYGQNVTWNVNGYLRRR